MFLVQSAVVRKEEEREKERDLQKERFPFFVSLSSAQLRSLNKLDVMMTNSLYMLSDRKGEREKGTGENKRRIRSFRHTFGH